MSSNIKSIENGFNSEVADVAEKLAFMRNPDKINVLIGLSQLKSLGSVKKEDVGAIIEAAFSPQRDTLTQGVKEAILVFAVAAVDANSECTYDVRSAVCQNTEDQKFISSVLDILGIKEKLYDSVYVVTVLEGLNKADDKLHELNSI